MSEARTALVYRGYGGLGTAIGHALVGDNTVVVVTDVRQDACEATAAKLQEQSGMPCLGLALDVADPASITSVVDTIADRFGVLHAVVNAAGTQRQRTFDTIAVSDWDRVMMVNVRRPFLLVQAAVNRLWKQQPDEASVVNIISRSFIGGAKDASYTASKGALASLTLEMALELGPLGVRANGVSPSFVRTAFQEQRSDIADLPSFLARYEAITPLARLVVPEDVAQVVAFLASERARGISGEIVHVTGGSHLPAQP